MPTPQSWHLILTNGEQTRIDGVSKVSNDGDTLSFENEQGETVCFIDRPSLVMAKRVEQSGSKR